MDFQVEQLIETLFHNSLKKPGNVETQHRQGGIFAVTEKRNLQTAYGVKGEIITSTTQLLKNMNNYSHFTPNTYTKYRYTNGFKEYVKGFSEENLMQVNAFVIDIDTKQYTPQDILLACLDDSIGVPTLLLASPRGYQLYFMLTSPLHIKKGGTGIFVAKKIAEQLKKSLSHVGADLFCNDFGFFRVPTPDNVVWINLEQTYDIAQLIRWSQQVSEEELFTKSNAVRHHQSLTNQAWFKALLQTPHIRGEKGVIGRNNTLFTLALACYADGISFSDAMCTLSTFNAQLYTPLSQREFEAIIHSAYSGRYQGPERFYIEQLTAAYTDVKPYVNYKGWYKHKKDRADRTRSHLHEWEQDIIRYIERAEKQDGFVWITQRALCEAIGIPKSTLNKLLKQSQTLLTRTFGKGRKAITGFSTRTIIEQEFIARYLAKKERTTKIYAAFLLTCIHEVEIYDASVCRTLLLDDLHRKRSTLLNGPHCHYISVSRQTKSTAYEYTVLQH